MSTVPPAAPRVLSQDDSCAKSMTLADCVPWLEIAMDFIDRGPSGITIEAVERYRRNLMEIIEHIRTAVEREAKRKHVH
jgi:hypothetical protein